MPPHTRGAPDILDDDISFPLERLFDHYNMDHIPEERRLDQFAMRDLPLIRHYKAAVRIFGGPASRKRVIIAPPMETNMKHRLGLYQGKKMPTESLTFTSELKPQILPMKPPSEEEVEAMENAKNMLAYRSWMSNRKELRHDLDELGLNEKWLQGKCSMTSLEARVLRRIEDEKKSLKKSKEPVAAPPESRHHSLSPSPNIQVTIPAALAVPSPAGLHRIENHMAKMKTRLLDIFKQLDKGKKWSVSKADFTKSIKEAKLDINNEEIVDLVNHFDVDSNLRISYGQLARGLTTLKREKREKHKRMSQASSPRSPVHSAGSRRSDRLSPLSFPGNSPRSPGLDGSERNQIQGTPDSSLSAPTPDKSEGGSSTHSRLELPESDLRPEQLIQSPEAMVDVRKHDKYVLARSEKRRKSGAKGNSVKESEIPTIIKTGNKAIDDHIQVSTLDGEVGEMVDLFRWKRLEEYYAVIDMCEKKGVPLTTKLLERVLLYPPDKPTYSIDSFITQPGKKLLSTRFSSSPKARKQPMEVRHRDTMKRSKTGHLMIDSRHVYPQGHSHEARGHKMNLSTGKAVICRKVDCWMTFEEYERLTGHLAVRYKQLHGTVDNNAFWPGHLLDKLCLCMPTQGDHSAMALFHNTRQPKRSNLGYDNNAKIWPVGPQGHVTYPSFERQRYI